MFSRAPNSLSKQFSQVLNEFWLGGSENANKSEAYDNGDWIGSNKSASKHPDSESIVREIEESLAKKRLKNAAIERKIYFEVPGKYEWLVPEGVNSVEVEVVGAGGAGSKARFGPEIWGEPKEIGPIKSKSQYGRDSFKDGQMRLLSEIEVPGPFRLELLMNPNQFLHFIEIVPDYESKLHMHPGSLKEVVCEQHGIHKLVFNLGGKGPDDGAWRSGRSRNKINKHYHGAQTFEIQMARVSHKVPTIVVGNGGGSGGYSKKTLTGLKGKEPIFITVGKSTPEGPGEDSKVVWDGQEVVGKGGGVATQQTVGLGGNGLGGDAHKSGNNGSTTQEGGDGGEGFFIGNNANYPSGSGGNGASNVDSPKGGSGNCGAVVITFNS